MYSLDYINTKLIDYENDYLKKYVKSKSKEINVYVPVKVHSLFFKCSKDKVCDNLILVHGTAGSIMSYVHIIDKLTNKYNIYVIDLPGFGRSPKEAGTELGTNSSTDFYCQVLYNYIKQLDIREPTLCGHSFGGFLCAKYCINHDTSPSSPYKIKRLILINPAGIFPTLGSLGYYWALMFKFSGRLFGIIGYIIMTLIFILFNFNVEHFYWYYILAHPDNTGDLAVADKISFDSIFDAYWNDPIFNDLDKIKCPVDFIYGSDDVIIPAQQGLVINEVYGSKMLNRNRDHNTKIHIVKGLGHNSIISDEVCDIIIGNTKVAKNANTENKTYKTYKTYKKLKQNYTNSFNVSKSIANIEQMYRDIGIDDI